MATITTEDESRTEAPREAPASTASYDSRSKTFNYICMAVLVVFSIIWLIPLAWAVDTALKPNAETTKAPITWLIDNPTLDSFQTALSRLRFKGRSWVLFFVLAGLLIPGQVLIVPQFREVQLLGLLNTYWAVILPQIPAAIAVFIFKQFFDGLPRELDEAARVDGASSATIYRQIVMPLSRPAVSAVAIFTFVWSWNNLLWPLLVLTNPKLMTIQVGLATVQGSYGIRYADIMASALLGGLPLILLFLFFQRRIVEGIAGTGLKG